jgi:hypothetical protein
VYNCIQRIYNPVDNSDHSCLKCAELDSQLEETCRELSSSQLITKPLYKEINDIITEKTSKPTNTNSECETGVDVASSNKWSSVASKRPYNKNKARNSDIYQGTQPIESANRYAILTNLPKTTICQDGNVAPKITKVTQISTNNCVQKKIHGRIRNPLVTLHPGNTTEQLPPNHHEVQGESMCDQNQIVYQIL